MLDIEGVVLHKILEAGDLDNFSKLRLNFFSKLYSPLFKLTYKFYLKQGKVPTFDELFVAVKEPILLESLHALQLLSVPDVPTELAVSSLIDKYMQDEALSGIAGILNKITYLDTNEIKESIGSLLLDLDSKLNTDENVLRANNITFFEEKTVSDAKRVPTGISNWIDANVGGFFEEDLVLLGGYRGAGKSLVCANIAVNQYQQGNVTAYFTIEMTGKETFDRIMSIMSQVPFSHIKLNEITREDELKLVQARADMFANSDELVIDFMSHRDKFKFERDLLNKKHVKEENQIVIVDDRELTIPTIDFTIQKLKAVHGDRLKVVVVDYLNQVSLGGSYKDTMYDWKDQLVISKLLKNIARKHKVSIVSPYQISDDGVARLSKAILDSCDMALVLKNETTAMTFTCVKARSSKSSFDTRVGLNADTLTLNPAELPKPEVAEEEPKKKGRASRKYNDVGDDV